MPIKCHSPQPRKLIGKGVPFQRGIYLHPVIVDPIGSRGQTLQGLYIWCPKHLSQCCDTWPSSRVQHHLWRFSVLVQVKHFGKRNFGAKECVCLVDKMQIHGWWLIEHLYLQIYIWNPTWWFPIVLFQRTHFQVPMLNSEIVGLHEVFNDNNSRYNPLTASRGCWNPPTTNRCTSPFPFPLQNGWGRAIYKPNFLVILGVWDMPLAPTIL